MSQLKSYILEYNEKPLAIYLKQHTVIAYFVLAYAISWAVELPLVASAQGWLQAK